MILVLVNMKQLKTEWDFYRILSSTMHQKLNNKAQLEQKPIKLIDYVRNSEKMILKK